MYTKGAPINDVTHVIINTQKDKRTEQETRLKSQQTMKENKKIYGSYSVAKRVFLFMYKKFG